MSLTEEENDWCLSSVRSLVTHCEGQGGEPFTYRIAGTEQQIQVVQTMCSGFAQIDIEAADTSVPRSECQSWRLRVEIRRF